jgi:putative ATP-binding cassette transporter
MNLALFLWRYSRRIVAVAIVLGIVGGAGSAALMALINGRLTGAQPLGTGLIWGYAGLVAVVMATNLTSRVLLNYLSEQATYELRMRLCERVLSVPLRHLEELGAHKVLAALTQDINVITAALLSFPMMCINLAIMAGCIIYLGWLSLTVLLTLVVFLAVAVSTVELMQRRAQVILKQARDEWDHLVEHFRALTEGTKELKMNRRRREAFLSELIQDTALRHRHHDLKGRNRFAIATSWNQVLYFIFIGVILYALPSFQEISHATLIGFTLTALYMRTPVVLLMDTLPVLKRAEISLAKVEELGLSLVGLVQPETLPVGEASPALEWTRLDVVGVTHTFYREREDCNFTLGPLNLTLQPGELIFLVGGNGSGKTTFAKLLTGLYAPWAGEIKLDGVPVTDQTRDSYRQYFSVIFSDFFLFDRLLGLDNPNLDAHARDYIVKLHLDHKVEVRGGALSTTDLSRGQRKRLALLTAYLEDRPIYVFDEWAADQDYVFKEIFYLHLLPELKAKGKTVVVISHDDQYYYMADRIVKLENGKIDYDGGVAKFVMRAYSTFKKPLKAGLSG